MKLQSSWPGWRSLPKALVSLAFCLGLLAFAAPQMVRADVLNMPPEVGEDDLRPNLPQPYIVKKGDTLWDIAKYFFKDPLKWYKIWERNLYITNPDLIYPGNEIWFDVRRRESGGLTTVRPVPAVRVKPVERNEGEWDAARLVTALKRQDFIRDTETQGVGYILDAEDERIHFGANDRLYLRLSRPAKSGDRFDIFRTGDPVRDPRTGETVGVLVQHLGTIELIGRDGDVWRGIVTEAFAEIERGDRLKPARSIDPHLTPDYPAGKLEGVVLYIRDQAAEAGQGQVVGVDLGEKDGVRAGTMLSVHRAGRFVRDHVRDEKVRLPEEKIGEMMVLLPQERASIALITQSTASINIGDTVRNQAEH
ncbi:MAG: LysM peptidoglycan-binding domain-containing protein [Mariprofundaceae bacterium]